MMTKKPHSKALTQSSALALATGLALSSSQASAQFNDGSFQADGVVVEGQAQIIRDFDVTEVIVESEGVVIDWLPDDDQGFGDIDFQPFGTIATFRDDGIVTDFAVLNRILPTDLSRRIIFDGSVISEIQGQVGGTVFFYSPGGILVGSNAVFDVGNLGLTTAEPVTDGFGNFILGNTVDFAQSLPNSEIIIDPGAQIFANQNPGSYVALFAPRIINRGSIVVDGQAALVGAESGTITFSPDGLFDIQVDIGSEFGQPIENSGFIGGAASADGSNRVYMVAISKNSAATIAITGGSSLGFDIANSAFMDGDTVVLSAGFNIAAGEIDPVEVSNGFLNINPEDVGFGAGATFTSSVIGKAASDVNLNVRDTLEFQGDATFSARQALLFLDTNFGTGTVGNLTVGGDLTLLADHTRAGADVGVANLAIFNGATADIGGNVRIGSIATGDGNGDGRALAATSQVVVDGAGSVLNVGGNLISESSVDLSGTGSSPIAEGGFAQVAAENSGMINVSGVTRIKSDAIAGAGADANAGTSELQLRSGGQLNTGELNITADATAGANTGFGGHSAFGGTARIRVEDTGSLLTVLSANTIGDASAGELDFLSSEAFATDGISGNGGVASTSNIDVIIGLGGSVSLPDSPGAPLTVASRAISGDATSDTFRGGDANTGFINFQVSDGVQDLGSLSIVSETFAGSAAPGTAQGNGGNANQAGLAFNFSNTAATISIDEIRMEARGGNASEIDGGFGGSANSGSVNFNVFDSQVDVNSALNISSISTGGSSGVFAGSASTGQIGLSLQNSGLNVIGDFTMSTLANGGLSLNDQVFDPNFAFSEQGGNANSGSVAAFINSSQLTAGGIVGLSSQAIAGNALVNRGGDAFSGEAFVSIQSLGISSTITSSEVSLTSIARGGSIDNPGNMDDFGTGGNANTGRTAISFDGGDSTIDSSVSILNQAEGGNAGQLLGNGGSAGLGPATLGASVPGSATITGDWTSQTIAIGGDAGGGLGLVRTGGDAFASVNEIFNHGGDVTIGGNATFTSVVEGGDGQSGGNANGSLVRINTNLGSITQIGGSLAFNFTATGGDGTFGLGGNANGGSLLLDAGAGSSINIGESLQFGASSTAGSSSENRGGDAFGAGININAIGGGANISVLGANPQLPSFITSTATGGNAAGGNGGAAQGGFISLQAFDGGSLNLPNNAGAPLVITQSATGGDTDEDDGAGGDASGSSMSIFVDNSTSNLGNLSLISRTVGGSALVNAERTRGGNANIGNISFSVSNADVDVAFDGIVIEGIGGNGSGDGAGVGGNAQFGGLNFVVNEATLDVMSNLIFQGVARAGDGAIGGTAFSPNANLSFTNSTANITGDVTLDVQTFGGMGLDASGAGGDANGQPVSLNIENSTLNTNGIITLSGSAVGGDAQDGNGGAANTGGGSIGISGGSILNAAELRMQESSMGGSSMGTGSGGAAMTGGNSLNYSVDGSSNEATVNTDVSFTNIAVGGDAGALGGDGGTATSGGTGFNVSTPSTLSINGSTSIDSQATGGNATAGLGGSATTGSNNIFAFSGGSFLLGGDLNIDLTGRGGNGLIGGDVTGGSTNIFARGTVTVDGVLTSNEQLFGGDAIASETPGAGGNVQGGSTSVSSLNEASIALGLVTLSGIDVNSTITGGRGGDGLTGADGGAGGNATGGGGTILGRAINGGLQLNGAVTVDRNVFGGQGGDGVNGGDGGQARFGGMQIGTASGGSISGQIDGFANFTTITVTGNNVGGDGGAGTTGVGGDGGEAVGGSVTLLGRGGAVTADTVTFTQNGTGGNGGAGAAQGNGGDGVGGSATLLITAGLDNPGRGNGANIGTFTINSAGVGGTGAIAGANEHTVSSFFEVDRADVVIGSFTANFEGDSAPDYLVDDGMGNLTPVTFNPYFLTLRAGSTLDFANLDITTGGELEIFANDAIATGDTLNIQASGLVASGVDVRDPAFVPGLFDITNSIVIETTTGDLNVETLLASAGDLTLNSAGGITTLDLTGSSVFLTLGAGGALDTTGINAPGGLISIEAVDDLIAPDSVDAASLILRSSDGSVIADTPLDLTGDLTAEAALSINLEGATAQNVNLNASGGDIFSNGAIDAVGIVDLTAGGGIVLAEVNAETIVGFAQTRGFSATSLTANNSVEVEADGTISIADINTGILALRSANGFVNSTGTLQASDDAGIEATNGSINLNNVTAGSVTGVAGVDFVVSGAIASTGAVDLEATGGGLVVGNVNAGSINLRSLDNNVVVQGGLTSMGAVAIDAVGSVFLDGVFVGALDVSAGAGDITATGNLNADAAIALNAGGSVTVGDVTAGSILGRAEGGSISAGNLSAANGSVDLEALGAIDFANIDTLSVILRSINGTITASGAIDAQEDADIEANGDVTIQMASASTLGLRSLTGSVTANETITAGNAANIAGGNGVALTEISAGSLDVSSSSGDINVSGTSTAVGAANFNAGSGAVIVGDVNAASITISASDAAQANSPAPGTQTTAQATSASGDVGSITTGSLNAGNGDIGLSASGSVDFGDVNAGNVAVLSNSDDITANGAVNASGGASFTAQGTVTLGDVTANAIVAQARDTATIGGVWQAPNVTINAANIDFGTDGAVDTGADGNVALGSTLGEDVLVGGPADVQFEGLVLSQDLLERFGGSRLAINGGGDGANVRIDDLDVTGFAGLSELSFTSDDSIDVVGALISPVDVSLQASDVRVNLDTASIDLGTDGTTLTVNAGVFVAGDSNVLDNGSSDLSNEEIQALINTPAATPRAEGVITTGSLVLNVGEIAVIQNVGTEDVPAGFVIGGADGLTINGNQETGTLVVLNGQIAEADGTNVTGDDAATQIFSALEDPQGIGAGSQINGCLFAGCTAVSEDTGEITSTVSASVSGATAAATSSTSGTATTTTDTGSTGGTSDAGSSSDSGSSDSGGDSSESSEESGSEEADASGTPGGAAASGTGSTSGVDVTVENVDDGGGGPGEFDIDSGDSSGSTSNDAGADAGSSDAGSSDAGSDAGADADTDAGSDSSTDEGGSEADSGSDEGESSSDEGDASDEGDEGESESDAEESEEGEDSEESEEESEEEEEESSEEEEDSEGPATGPIAAPPSLINTNTLEQRGTINDPISGSGNPALLDPDVTATPPADSGGQ